MNLKLHFLILPALVALLPLWPATSFGAPASQSIVHVVQAGETLSGIAARYRVSPAALQSANQVANSDRIYVNMRLTIPIGSSSVSSGAASASTPASQSYATTTTSNATAYAAIGGALPAAGCGSEYTVRPGDTLYGVAARCQVSAAALASANRLGAWAFLFVGQRLQMPTSGLEPAAVAAATTSTSVASAPNCADPYRVQAGDTLSALAVRCGTNVTTLRDLNRLSSDVIRTGQTLILRGNPEAANQWLPLVLTSTAAQASAPTATEPPSTATLAPTATGTPSTPALAPTAATILPTPTPASTARPSPTPRIEPAIRP